MLNAVIELTIGLIVLYSLLSLMCSKTNELLANVLSLRARNLRRAIQHLVGEAYVIKVYEHPMILSLYRGDARPEKGVRRLFQSPGPSYLPAQKFVIAVLDSTCPTAVTADPPLPPDPGDRLQYALIAERDDGDPAPAGVPPRRVPPSPAPGQVERDITAEINQVTDAELRRSLETLWRAASHNVVTFRAGVEQWFDHTMDRASGWYKRMAQTMALVLGLIIAVGLNIDTVHVSERLWADSPVRSAVLEQVKRVPPPSAPTTTVAGAPATEAPPTTAAALGAQVQSIQDGLGQVGALHLPLGWAAAERPDSYWVAVLGWLLTAIALSLGAPFWFDLLNKVTALRGGGTKETTPTQSPQPAGTPR
ncbi:MAG TPA: hypothetical protein VHS52_09810 [Acidimicrobiales bacterium]|jgi:hypothetical protein|nr:hypothetical protein [Acidimicrobiales bacterium]